MHKRLTAAAALLAAGLAAGCTPAKAGPDSGGALTAQTRSAVSAGGACLLLPFETVARILGVRFDVAAATQRDRTYSCVVQARGRSRPDLALTVAPTTADVAVFKDKVVPRKAAAVPELGRAAYRMFKPGTRVAGPAVEVGWLTADGRLVILRYTLAPGSPAAAATAGAARLVSLAKAIDAERA